MWTYCWVVCLVVKEEGRGGQNSQKVVNSVRASVCLWTAKGIHV